MKKSLLFYFPAFAWACIIFYLCSMPPSDVDKISFFNFPHIDKVAHFTFYFVLVGLLLIADWKILKYSTKRVIYWISVSILYSIIIEILQGCCFEGRSASVFDASFNSLGAISGFLAFRYIFLKYWKN